MTENEAEGCCDASTADFFDHTASPFSLNPGPIVLKLTLQNLRHTSHLSIRINILEPILTIYCDASFGTHYNDISQSYR